MGAGPLRFIVVGTIAQIALIMVARRPVATAAYAGSDIAKQVNGDREADECEHERMVWMTGKIIGHSGSPWLVAGNRSVPSPRSKTRTLSPRSLPSPRGEQGPMGRAGGTADSLRSEEHTSELQSLMRISYAVFCLKKKKKN